MVPGIERQTKAPFETANDGAAAQFSSGPIAGHRPLHRLRATFRESRFTGLGQEIIELLCTVRLC
jgi:hypothetical protein